VNRARKFSDGALALLVPVLLGILGPVYLLSANVGNLALEDVSRSLVVIGGLSLALGLILSGLYRSPVKGALLAALVVLVLISYGHVYEVVKGLDIAGVNVGRHRYLLPLAVGAILFSALWILRTSTLSTQPVLLAVGVAASLGLLSSLPPVVRYYWASSVRSGQADPWLDSRESALPVGGSLPDIYYIVLDMHGRADILASLFGYDAGNFVRSLERQGFYVADRSLANYAMTPLSLASSLNMRYLDDVAEDFAGTRNLAPVKDLLSRNEVFRLARRVGYRVVVLESAALFVKFDDVDSALRPDYQDARQDFTLRQAWLLNPFEGILAETTILRAAMDLQLERQSGDGGAFWDYNYQKHRIRTLWQFEVLPELAREVEGPKLVFVHVMAPHPPFVFGAQGEEVEQTQPFTLAATYTEEEYRSGFVGQVRFVDALTLGMVDALLQASDETPIVLLQGDTGSSVPREYEYPAEVWRLEQMAILNALLVPEACRAHLYPELTPVNTFRIVFGSCLGIPLPLLEDRSLHSTYQTPYLFTPVENEDISQ
jgi:hypothetical protein